MEFKGVLRGCVGTRSGTTDNGNWERRVYLVEELATNAKRMVFEISDGEQGRYARWDDLIGKNVTVRFTIEARESHGRYFNNINAWEIWESKQKPLESNSGQQPAPAAEAKEDSEQHPFDAMQQASVEGEVKTDDLPF